MYFPRGDEVYRIFINFQNFTFSIKEVTDGGL